MADFDLSISYVCALDEGSPSFWGVPLADIFDEPQPDLAKSWKNLALNQISSQPVATKVLAMVSALGEGTAAALVQEVVGEEEIGKRLTTKHRDALNAMDPAEALKALRKAQAKYYAGLAEQEGCAEYLPAWMTRAAQ